jgi:WD40 repeat protein
LIVRLFTLTYTLITLLVLMLASSTPAATQALQADTIVEIAWSPDQTKIAVGRLNGGIEIVRVSDGQLLMTLNSHTQYISRLRWASDGLRLASTSGDGYAKVWDVNSGQELLNLSHPDTVTDAIWNADDSQLITAMEFPPHNLRVWDASSGQPRAQYSGNYGLMAISPDGNRLLSIVSKDYLSISDMNTFGNTNLFSQPNVVRDVLVDVVWHPSGNAFVTAHRNGLVKVWDANTGAILQLLVGNLSSGLGPFDQTIRAVFISPSGTILSAVGMDGTFRKWNTGDWHLIHDSYITTNVWAAAFSPDGQSLAYVENGTQLRVVEVAAQTDLGTESQISTPVAPVAAQYEQPLPDTIIRVEWSPTQDRVALSRLDGTIEIRNGQTGQTVFTLSAHTGGVTGLRWNGDGTRLASSGADQTARIWNALTGQLLMTMPHPAFVLDVLWNRDGSQIITSIEFPPDNLRVWDAATGQLVGQHTGRFDAMTFDPVTNRILSAVPRNMVTITDASTFTMLHVFQQPDTPGGDVNRAIWSPDSIQFATGHQDGAVKIWDATTGNIVQTFQANFADQTSPFAQNIRAIAFSPDGSIFSAVGMDGTFRRWNTADWQLIHDGYITANVWAAAFSPDGQYLAYVENGNQLRIVEVAVQSNSPCAEHPTR